jgi:hypothetical protein
MRQRSAASPRERYDGACFPVLEVDRGSIFGSDGIHLCYLHGRCCLSSGSENLWLLPAWPLWQLRPIYALVGDLTIGRNAIFSIEYARRIYVLCLS